ncbi:hypothetical protein L4C54_19865 [Vibrio lamellibrachiae]|uniref:hypothetical protein n=1 Tax=Vibrio lamellibrachiae TaxID=2910253 RepID=UPI003D0F774F
MVILLNGSINSGKSTIGNAFCTQQKFAFIEGDSLRDCVRWMDLQDSIQLSLTNAAALASNFEAQGINSLIAYPLDEFNFQFIKELLSENVEKIVPISLTPCIDVLQSNRGNRVLSDKEISRISELVEGGIAYPEFGSHIDNSLLSVDETVAMVLEIATSA